MQEPYTVFLVGLAAILIAPAATLLLNREGYEAWHVGYLQDLQEEQNQKILDAIQDRE